MYCKISIKKGGDNLYKKYEIILFITLISALYLFSSCYTVVERTETPRKEQNKYLNHKLTGTWVRKITWKSKTSGNDHYQIKKIVFTADGEIIFWPHWERRNSFNYSGNFTIKGDTLNIELLNNSFTETFIYNISDLNLTMKRINNYPLNISVAGKESEIWVKKN